MKIRKKRIRSLGSNLTFVEPGEAITPSFNVTDATRAKLAVLGLDDLIPGTTVLPKAVGPVSRFNAEGKALVLRHLSKETMYRQVEWHRVEFHGKERIDVYEIRDVPYERYPREFVPPPSIELSVAANADGQLYIVGNEQIYSPENEANLRHEINLVLELFGECEILKSDLTAFVPSTAKRLNWEILPKGKLPWERISAAVKPAVERARKGNRPAIWARIKTLNDHQPDFHAVGRAGFNGYIVFGFVKLGIYVLESKNYGNATYVFKSDWETLSQMTKAEVLNQDLHHARLVHRSNWPWQLRRLLRDNGDEGAAGKVAA